jgi:hypothetical protein
MQQARRLQHIEHFEVVLKRGLKKARKGASAVLSQAF